MAVDRTFSLFTTSLIVISVIFPLLATFVVGLRVYVRKRTKQAFLWDDWIIFIALALCWGLSVNVWVFASIIGVNRIQRDPQKATSETFKFMWAFSIPFALVLGIVKISVVFFYKRIFSSVRVFYIASWVMIVVLGLWTAVNVFVSTFKSNPVPGIWTDPDKTYIIDANAFSLANADMSLCFDVMVLTMPLFVIHKLQMPLVRKLAVMMIFWLGALCCIAGAMRLQLLYKSIYIVTANPNAYSTLTESWHWAALEPNASVIAASLPMLRPLFTNSRRTGSDVSLDSRRRLFSKINTRMTYPTHHSRGIEPDDNQNPTSQHVK